MSGRVGGLSGLAGNETVPTATGKTGNTSAPTMTTGLTFSNDGELGFRRESGWHHILVCVSLCSCLIML